MHKITVQLTHSTLYDFMLYHTYSKFSGFMMNILGFAVIFLGGISLAIGRMELLGALGCVIAGILFVAYTPFLLKRRAKKEVERNPEYKNPVEYTFSEDEGIYAKWDGGERHIEWSRMERAVVAPKTIGIYYGKDDALILPKENFGKEFAPIYQMIVRKLSENSYNRRIKESAEENDRTKTQDNKGTE